MSAKVFRIKSDSLPLRTLDTFKKVQVSQQKRQNDYGQNYYKIYHLAVAFNIASNKYWKDLLRLFILQKHNCFAPNSLALLFF